MAGDGRNGFGCLTVLSAMALGAAVLLGGAARMAPAAHAATEDCANTYGLLQPNATDVGDGGDVSSKLYFEGAYDSSFCELTSGSYYVIVLATNTSICMAYNSTTGGVDFETSDVGDSYCTASYDTWAQQPDGHFGNGWFQLRDEYSGDNCIYETGNGGLASVEGCNTASRADTMSWY
jgi:hypothetical protein